MRLVLIRHGEIDSNVAKVYSGRSAEPLNETGRMQAHQASKQLHGLNIFSLFTSPLLRAQQTAAIVGQRIARQPIVLEALNELKMGPWEGLSESEVAERYPDEFSIWNRTPADLCLPGRETLGMLQKRVISGLVHALNKSGNCESIAIVSHVAVIRALVLFTEDRPLNDYKRIHVPNASPIVVEWRDEHLTEAARIHVQ